MKLISWNVNGIRSVARKGALEFLTEQDPDIFCVQETKAHPDQIGSVLSQSVLSQSVLSQYEHQHWSAAERKGYSGTAVFTKNPPTGVSYGVGSQAFDREGRVITLEYRKFYLVNVYTPNAQRELTRLDYRLEWDRAFLEYLKALDTRKPVMTCGDFNVAHQEIDLARPQSNHNNAGFTDQERDGFTRLLEAGFIDSFRQFKTEGGHYTWWAYMHNARQKNVGWRIDYFCLSERIRAHLTDAFILSDVMGSDHCPIGVVVEGLR